MTSHYPLIEAASAKHRLDARLVAALVLVESSGNHYAHRPEVGYRWPYDVKRRRPFRVTKEQAASKTPPEGFPSLTGNPQQEWTNQQASWGLTQLMGAVARELGFYGPYLTELTDPQLNLDLGCKLLAQRVAWADGDLSRALAAYNAGVGGADSPAGRAYAAKVLGRRDALRVQP